MKRRTWRWPSVAAIWLIWPTFGALSEQYEFVCKGARSEFRMTPYLLLLATLMVLAYGYSRKRAFVNFGQSAGPSAGAASASGALC